MVVALKTLKTMGFGTPGISHQTFHLNWSSFVSLRPPDSRSSEQAGLAERCTEAAAV